MFGARRRLVVALVATLPLAAGCSAGGSQAARTSEETPVPCTKAVAFFDQTALPQGATKAQCRTSSFQDTLVDITFEADRDAVDRWLTGLPGSPRLTDQGCDQGTLCTPDMHFVPQAKGGADYLALTAAPISGSDRLTVAIRAFST